MKEQVKEWIVDKNLTTDSFDSIMIGVIYNSGHSTLDDPDVRKWIETHPSEFRGMLLPKLTDDQQVVLDYLIKQAERCSDIGYLVGDLNFFASTEDGKAWDGLTEKERYQVLAVFAEWGNKEGEG